MNLQHLSKNCAILINDLLQHNVEQRLGCSTRGALDLFEHPWFAQMNFWSLYQQKYLAPFIPIRKSILSNQHRNDTILTFTANNQYENDFIDF